MPEHQYRKPNECTCGHRPGCFICDGGLAVCKLCKNYEGGLTTECPGVPAFDASDEIYRGHKDFINGRWVHGISIYSPAYYRPLHREHRRTAHGLPVDFSKSPTAWRNHDGGHVIIPVLD